VGTVDKRSGRTFLRLGPSVWCAGLEAAEAFWYRVYVQACRGGLGQTTRRVVVLGDGAQWIWKRAAQFGGGPHVEVREIVDINHAYDHLWAVGRAVFDLEAAPWVAPLKDRRYAEGAGAVLAALDALVPPTPPPRKWCAPRGPTLSIMRRAWTTRASWRSSCPLARAPSRACARA
jgi:hypothetical protein